MSTPPSIARPPAIRWVGPHQGLDFGPCYEEVKQSAEILPGGSRHVADLTVVACRRPLAQVGPLEVLSSDGPVVQLLGVWCEGEQRTGKVAAGVERVFWHAWSGWWRVWLQPERSLESLPATVTVLSDDQGFAKAVNDSLAAAGVTPVGPNAAREQPTAILWDGVQLSGGQADQLATLCRQARRTRTPVIAFLDFPRPETVAAARAIGAAAVLGKPFDRGLLLTTFQSVVARCPQARCLPFRSNWQRRYAA